MIVKADRKYFNPSRYDSLKKGETFSIDSHLGGSHTVEYLGMTDRGHHFRCINYLEWPLDWYFKGTDEISQNLFILVPASLDRI